MGQTQSVSINVKLANKDLRTCDIKEICLLTDGRFALTDASNQRLKILDASNTVTSSPRFDGVPFGVCETEIGHVATTCQYPRGVDKVSVLNVNDNFSTKGEFTVNARCNGIEYASGILYVCCGMSFVVNDSTPGHIRLYTLTGELQRTIPHDVDSKAFVEPLYIIVSNDVTQLHVTDGGKGLVSIDTRDDVHYSVPCTSDFSAPRGMCQNSRGEIIVCDIKSNALVEMTFTKTEVKVTVKESDRITRPQAICIRETDGQIIVSCQNSDSLEIFNAS